MATENTERASADRLELVADALVPEAIEWIAEMKKYRTYQGNNPEYYRKARAALGMIGGAVRLLATIENNRSNSLIARRLALETPPAAPSLEARAGK